jgi:3-methyladenine DNA glycosylase Tag
VPLLVGPVRRPHERAREDRAEAERLALLAEPAELVRVHPAVDRQRRGFRFVGPTICYALMQACGLVNDHTTDCFRHAEVA